MKSNKKIFLDNWQDEQEAILLYAQMAKQENDPSKKKIYQNLANIEKKHASIWEKELKKIGIKPKFKPRFKTKFLSFLGKLFGHEALLDQLEKGEGSAVSDYSGQAQMFKGTGVEKKLKEIIPEEKSHSKVLKEMKIVDKFEGESWHKGGEQIRDVIFGMNDGLLSTFSLVAGVTGAAVSNSIVLLAGLAGAVAGAISMAAGAFVSVKAEKEVMEKHLESEKREIETMPETEMEELALMYELKGIDKKRAKKISKQIMANKDVALETMAREELGFAPGQLGSPFKAGIASGISFSIGAAVPILPFIFLGAIAFKVAIILSLSSFFIIGAGRTLVTGKNAFKSGLEMFLIGTGAAIITYLIGSLIGV